MATETIFWFLILVTSIPGLKPWELHPNTLNVGKELDTFQYCSIHVVTTAVDGKDPYNLETTSIPLIQSTYFYINASNEIGRDYGGIECDQDSYTLIPNQGFIFLNYPSQPKFNCHVEVYITPPSCSRWHIDPITPWSSIVPQSHYDFHSDNVGSKTQPTYINRMGRFFILITSQKPQEEINEIFYAIDEAYTPIPQIYFKTKLYFEIEASTNYESNIGSTFVVSRPGDGSANRYNCKLEKYSARSFENPDQLANLEQFPKSSEWNIICSECGESQRLSISDNGMYLTTWSGMNRIPIEAIFLHILAPNSTIKFPGVERTPTFPNPTLQIQEGTNMKQIMAFWQGYHFVTCAPPDSYVDSLSSFIILLQAFDNFTWFFLLISCVGSGIVLYLILRYKKDKFAILNPTVTMAFAFNLLLDHHSGVLNKCKFIGGTWLFMVIVLIGGYEGLTIGQLTAPRKTVTNRGFQSLIGRRFNIHTKNIIDGFNFPLHILEDPGYAFLLRKIEMDGWKRIPATHFYYLKSFDAYFKTSEKQNYGREGLIIENIRERLNRPRNLNEAILMQYQEYFVEILERCGYDAFIGDYDSVRNMYLGLKNSIRVRSSKGNDQLGISQDSLAMVSKAWLFYYIPWSSDTYTKRVHSMQQSGLSQIWQYWKNLVPNIKAIAKETLEREIPTRISMHGQILIVFYLWGILIAISMIFFIIEMRKKIWAEIKWVCRTLWKFIKRVCRECKNRRSKKEMHETKLQRSESESSGLNATKEVVVQSKEQ